MTQQSQVKYRHDYRAPEYLTNDTDLASDLDAAKTIAAAESEVSRHVAASDVPLRFDGEDLILTALQVNGQPWSDYKEENNQLVIGGLLKHSTSTIVNEISPAASTALEGLYQSGEALCIQCEAEGFCHIIWYLGRPDVLARPTTKIIADKAKYPLLSSNGNRMVQGELENGRHWVQWQDPFPKPYYLLTLVAGDLDVLRDTFTTRFGREVTLELYVDRGNLDRAPWAMTSLKNSMKWDEERFGLECDPDIYMIAAVDSFNTGAVENKGLNVFNPKYVLTRTDTATDKDYLDIGHVIGHEYFHSWTGNCVTCRDWFQLSLKEGLTMFRDQKFSPDLGSRAVNRINNVCTMRGLQFAEDASPMAHPIHPDMVIEMNNLYTLTIYEKGAEVIRMLHTLLGEENFQKGMQLHFERRDDNAATCNDLVQAMEDAPNADLSCFRRWYSQSGTSIVTVYDDYNPETGQYTLIIDQRTSPTAKQAEKQPLHIPFAIELHDNEDKAIPLQKGGHPLHPVLDVTQVEQAFVFDNVYFQPVPALPCKFSALAKLEYKWNDQQLTFLMRHAWNDFSRWDAARSLLATYIKLNVNRYQQGQPLSLPTHVADAFRAILLGEKIDPALVAEILTLPSASEIVGTFAIINPITITIVREALTRTLVNELADESLVVYHANRPDSYRVEHADIGKRALRNTCLRYLVFAEPTLGDKLVSTQYRQVDNMADMLTAPSAAVAVELPSRDALVQEYDDKWRQGSPVMNKWFTLQSTSLATNAVETVRGLLNHCLSSASSPNRVRSLIGAFASNNPAASHVENDSGYQFLVEMLTELNQCNPQVVSRPIELLIRPKRCDEKRQASMRAALEQLKGLENLSGNLFEKINKALA